MIREIPMFGTDWDNEVFTTLAQAERHDRQQQVLTDMYGSLPGSILDKETLERLAVWVENYIEART